jgi:type III pantothenate kinase
MKTSTIILNIGNTRSQWAVLLAEGRLGEMKTCATFDLAHTMESTTELPSADPYKLVIACVEPKVQRALLERLPADSCRFITHETARQYLKFDRVDPQTIGADRIANAVAAALDGTPVVVVDCGTAITLEGVDTEHQFLSIAILPGRRLARQALNSFTGQLPEVPMASELPPMPAKTTEHAIRNGCDLGTLGTVAHLIETSCKTLGAPDVRIVLTGGDADFFSRHLDLAHTVDKTLTLRGIAALNV